MANQNENNWDNANNKRQTISNNKSSEPIAENSPIIPPSGNPTFINFVSRKITLQVTTQHTLYNHFCDHIFCFLFKTFLEVTVLLKGFSWFSCWQKVNITDWFASSSLPLEGTKCDLFTPLMSSISFEVL